MTSDPSILASEKAEPLVDVTIGGHTMRELAPGRIEVVLDGPITGPHAREIAATARSVLVRSGTLEVLADVKRMGKDEGGEARKVFKEELSGTDVSAVAIVGLSAPLRLVIRAVFTAVNLVKRDKIHVGLHKTRQDAARWLDARG